MDSRKLKYYLNLITASLASFAINTKTLRLYEL